MHAISGIVLNMKVNNLMILSLFNQNSQFFHACQHRGMVLSTKVNNLMLLSF
jgi:hypothetical protein